MTFLIKKFVKFLHSRGYISITNWDAIDLLPGSVFVFYLGFAACFFDFTITLSDGSSFTPPLLGPGLLKVLLGLPLLLFGISGFVMFWHTKDGNELPSMETPFSNTTSAKIKNTGSQ